MTWIIDERAIATWHMQVDHRTDVMMGLSHGKEGGVELVWRFRYDHGTPLERKSWHAHATKEKTAEEAIATCRLTLAELRAGSPGYPPAEEILMDEGGLAAFTERLAQAQDVLAFIPGDQSPEEALEAYRNLTKSPPAGSA